LKARHITVLTIAALFGTGCATAGSATTDNTADEICPAIGSMARVFMAARQNDVPLSEARKVLKETELMQMNGTELFNQILFDAYDRNTYSTPAIQREVIVEFGNEVEIECYRQFAGRR
jgi:hypothetical protein